MNENIMLVLLILWILFTVIIEFKRNPFSEWVEIALFIGYALLTIVVFSLALSVAIGTVGSEIIRQRCHECRHCGTIAH